MAIEVGSAYVTILPSMRGFSASLSRELGAPMTQAGNQAGQQLGQGMQGAGQSAGRRFGTAMQTAIGSFAGNIAAQLTGKLAGLAKDALFAGFDRLTAIDDAKAKLAGLGHSAETVTGIMTNAMSAVKGTAFAMDEAATTAAGAVAAGIKPGKDLEAVLKTVADAATIGGTSMAEMGSIFNGVATSNKIQGDTIAQLSDRGIPIVQMLAKVLGKSAEETVALASAGKINFATFRQAMDGALGGAALKSGETFTGALKNARAALSRFGANIWAGIFPQLKAQLGAFTAAMAPMEERAKSVGTILGTVFAGGARVLSGALSGAAIGMSAFGGFVSQYREPILAIAVGVGVAGAAFGAYRLAIVAWTAATSIATAVQAAFAATLAFITSPIGIVVVAVAALAAALVYLYRNNETVRAGLNALWSGLQAAAAVAWAIVQPILAAMWGWLANTLAPAVQSFWIDTVQPVFGAIGAWIQQVWTNVILPALTALWQVVVQDIAPALVSLWVNVVQPVFSALGAFIAWSWTNVILPALTALWWFISNVLGPVISWLWTNIVSPIFGLIGSLISWVWSTIIAPALSAFFGYLTNTMFPAFKTLLAVVQIVFTAVGGKIQSTWQFISGVFESLKNGVRAVQDTFRVVVDAIGSTWDTLKAKVEIPIRFVVNDIVRDKLVAGWNSVAEKVGLPKWDFKGFRGGGYTGLGDKKDVAGAVHKDEFVIRSESQNDLRKRAPGLLDALNARGANALHGLIPGYAGGGLAKPWPTYVAAVARRMFPGILSVGGYGGRANASDHPSGNALDLMVPNRSSHPGDELAAWGLSNFSPLMLKYIIWKQRINSGGGWRGMANRGGDTANHFDHNHWSFQHDKWGNPGALGPILSPDEVAQLVSSGASGNPIAAIVNALLSPLFDGARGLVKGMTGRFGDNDMTKLVAGVPTKAIDAVQKFINDKVNALGSIGSPGPGDSLDSTTGLSGVKALVNAVAGRFGWGAGAQWDAIDWIVQHESGWNPKAQNPSSTAYGLFQLLNSTWAGTGIAKSSDPSRQGEAGLKYIQGRYDTPLGAKSFWQAHRYYDSGGILPPGVTVAVNNTGRPETIRTHEQEAGLQRQLASGPTQVHIHGDVTRDVFSDLMSRLDFSLAVAR